MMIGRLEPSLLICGRKKREHKDLGASISSCRQHVGGFLFLCPSYGKLFAGPVCLFAHYEQEAEGG